MTDSTTLRERWTRIAALFEAAMPLPPAERAAFLDHECTADPVLRGEIEALLAADSAGDGVLDAPLAIAAQPLLTLAPGTRVGPYRIERELGRGGMGDVYLASRADGAYEQQVAIKVVRVSPIASALEQRFLLERRILARLQHPNIARLLDAGVTQAGAPYLVMEFVAGETITRYAESRSLTIEERLRLVLDVCAAVQFAHANLVVHRDLKPSNILVTSDGNVRLLDFGIARLLDDPYEPGATRAGQLMLTPEYAAPEILRGEPATTATDLYALGAVLYELVAGHKVCEPGSRELMQILRDTENDPPRLARRADLAPDLRRRLRGDIDAIVHKALARDPAQRYASVESFAADLRRHLDHQPVSAQPESYWYRTAKFARRHRVGVAAGVAILLAVTAGLIGIGWQSHKRGLEAHKAEEVKTFVLGLFSGADPARARGDELTARELVEQGSARIEREFAGEPVIRAEVMTFLGDIHEKLGQPDKALESANAALDLLKQLPSEDSADVADATLVKGRALLAKGDLDGAESLIDRSLQLHRDAGLPLAVAEDLDQLAIIARQRGNLPESLKLTQEALEARRNEFGPEHPEVATSLNNLGVVAREMGDYPAALEYHESALAIRRRTLPPNHPDVGVSLNNLGALLFARGRYAEAERYFLDVVKLDTRVYGDAHPATIGAKNNLGSALLLQAKYSDALPMLQSVFDYWQTRVGAEHPNALATLSNIATTYRGLGRYREAEPLYRKLIATWPKVAGPRHPNVAVAHFHLGTMLLDVGALDDAERELRTALEIRREARGVEHPEFADSLRELGLLELFRGRPEVAEANVTQALAIQRRALEAGHPSLGATLLVQGRIMRVQRRLPEALQAETEGLRAVRGRFAADHPDVARAQLELGRTQFELGQVSEAERNFTDARRVFAVRYGEDSWRVADLNGWLAAIAGEREPEDARRRLIAAGKTLAAQLPDTHPAVRDNHRLTAALAR